MVLFCTLSRGVFCAQPLAIAKNRKEKIRQARISPPPHPAVLVKSSKVAKIFRFVEEKFAIAELKPFLLDSPTPAGVTNVITISLRVLASTSRGDYASSFPRSRCSLCVFHFSSDRLARW